MTLAPDPLAYDISVCSHEASSSREAFDLFGQGAAVRPLRRLPDGGLRSGVVSLPAAWRGGSALAAGAVVQILVTSGALLLGEREVGQGGFVVVPRGGVLPRLASVHGAEIIVILDDPDRLTPVTDDGAQPIVIPDVFAIDPIVPVVAGKRLEGFERRVLWEDRETGADTRLLRVPAGFEGTAGPNYHPVEEEIFCLEGDIAPDDRTPMRAGSFLWNPKLAVHGFHEHSNGGCLLLEWHDGPWAFHRYEGAAFAAV